MLEIGSLVKITDRLIGNAKERRFIRRANKAKVYKIVGKTNGSKFIIKPMHNNKGKRRTVSEYGLKELEPMEYIKTKKAYLERKRNGG